MDQQPNNTILFLTRDEQSPSICYRALNYFQLLKKSVWAPSHTTFTSGSSIYERWKVLRQATPADVVVVVRRTVSGLFTWLLRRLSQRLVFDIVDAIFCLSSGSESSVRQRRLNKITRQCDTVSAGNDFLVRKASALCKNTHVIPTAVKPPHHQTKQIKNDQFIDCASIGSSSTRRYLEKITPLIDKLTEKHPQLHLKIIVDFTPVTKTIEVLAVASSEVVENRVLTSAHIVITPMVEKEWTSGKFGLKVIQYMSAGLPVVTGNAGINKSLVDHEPTEFIASNKQQWQQATTSLVDDPSLRTQMGKKGREKTVRHYSLQASFEKMLASLSQQKIDQKPGN